jgi:hypothetical protein
MCIFTELKVIFYRKESLQNWYVFISQYALVYKMGLQQPISTRLWFQQLPNPSYLTYTTIAGLQAASCCQICYNIYSLTYISLWNTLIKHPEYTPQPQICYNTVASGVLAQWCLLLLHIKVKQTCFVHCCRNLGCNIMYLGQLVKVFKSVSRVDKVPTWWLVDKSVD